MHIVRSPVLIAFYFIQSKQILSVMRIWNYWFLALPSLYEMWGSKVIPEFQLGFSVFSSVKKISFSAFWALETLCLSGKPLQLKLPDAFVTKSLFNRSQGIQFEKHFNTEIKKKNKTKTTL